MDHNKGVQTAILQDLFSSKFAIHSHGEDSSASSRADESEPATQGDDETEDGLAELLQLINGIKLLPSSSKIDYAVPGLFNSINSHPIATGTFFQVRKLDQPSHNRQMVAKYPKLDPARKGGGISRENLQAIKLEIQALSHPPILDHPNIIDLLGFSWARLSAVEGRYQIVPVLLLEFASHGTLREYLSDNITTPIERLQFGKGLGEGLSTLHRSGIVHGDLKLDNVLVFDRPDGSVVAKLADFGSTVQLIEGGYQYRGGTPPWTAPEWRKSIEPWEQHAADVYSFGLLIWALCLEGRSPFPGLSAAEIEARKIGDVIENDAAKSVADHYDFYRHMVECTTELGEFELYLASVICPRRAFSHTLKFDPMRRNLDSALSALSVDDFYSSRKTGNIPRNRGPRNLLHEFRGANAYTMLSDMPQQVRQVLFSRFVASIEGDRISKPEKSQLCFQLALSHLDGFSDRPSLSTALPWLEKAAELGSESARGVIYRIFRGAGQLKLQQDPTLASRIREYLISATASGSRIARQDLLDLDPEAAQTATDNFRERFNPESMDPKGAKLDKQVIEAVISPRWQQGLSPAQRTILQGRRQRMYLNQKLGSLLHFASTYGVSLDIFEKFLDLEKPDIDAKDKDGNTPLLMAMRSGHGYHALALLRRSANPKISNQHGQTPCHWAIHVYDLKLLEELLRIMVSKGADLEGIAKRADTGDGRVYRQEQYQGTPLCWAIIEGREDLVSMLLRNGASPTTPGEYMSPFDLAVAYNSWRVIKLLLQYAQGPITSRIAGPTRSVNLEGAKRKITEDWVSFAMFGFPHHYHMILHGPSYRDALKYTLVQLRRAGLVRGDLHKPLKKALQSGQGQLVDDLLWYQSCRMREISSWDLAEMFISEASYISPDAAAILLNRIASNVGNCALPDMTPLLFTYPTSHRADVGIFRRLLDIINPDSVDIPDENGVTSYRHLTPFMLAVLGGAFEFATELLKRGADPNFRTTPANSSSATSSPVNIIHLLISVNEDTSLAALQYLLEPQHPFHDRKPDFVICEESGLTALTYEARWGNRLLFDYLSNHFDSRDMVDMRGRGRGNTALHIAALHGNYDVVVALVGRGAKVNVLARSDDGKLRSPLDFCYDIGVYDTNLPRTSRHWEDLWIARLRAAKFLAAKGSRMLIKHSIPIAFRFLLHACAGNWSRLFEEALEQTPEELKSEAYLNALLFRAAEGGSEDVVGLLLNARAHINSQSATGQTPLHRAALRGHMYTVKVLVQRGADLALRDNKGRTAAIQAFTQKHEGLVEYLMSRGSPKDLPQMVVVPFTAEFRNERTNAISEETLMATICFLNWPETDGGEEETAGLSSWLVRIHREDGGGDLGDSSRDPENWNREFASLTGRRGEGFHAAWRAAQIRADSS